jgi:hypothetical protein
VCLACVERKKLRNRIFAAILPARQDRLTIPYFVDKHKAIPKRAELIEVDAPIVACVYEMLPVAASEIISLKFSEQISGIVGVG